MRDDYTPFRYYPPKAPRPRESFVDAVVIPAAISIAKALLVVALGVILIAVARHG